MNETNFAIRTIKAGRIKLGGGQYVPSERHMKYDGRLDGQRFAFSRYKQAGEYQLYLHLWGTEAAFKDAALDATEGPQWVGGYAVWEWWRRVEERP